MRRLALALALTYFALSASAAPFPTTILSGATTTTSAPPTGAYVCSGNPQTPSGRPYAFQAFQFVETGTGAVTATIQLMSSLDGVSWANYGTPIGLSGTAPQVATAYGNAPFNCWAAVVTAISGTGASITAEADFAP
jgi:hypothetical protein